MAEKIKQLNNARWSKVSELVAGMKIAVPDIEEGILWDEIVSIKSVGRKEVWDIEVEGTHNFIGNDIFAHNTYTNGGPALAADVVAYDAAGNIGKAGPGDSPAGVMLGFGENGSISYEFNGRASVRVTDENGPLRVGDRLTVSKTQPGFAMKMTSAGQSIGTALADFPNIASASDKVMTFINVGYWAPDVTAVDSAVASGSYSNIVVTSSSNFGDLGSVVTATVQAVLTRVQSLWASGDVIAEGVKKTYFAVANIEMFKSLNVSELFANWTSRTISISPTADLTTQSLFSGSAAQAAEQSKTDLAENGAYIATYGVDSTRGEIQLSGSSKLVSGEARIFFDFSFSSIISDKAPLRVIITPTTMMQGQLYVDSKSQYGFVVKGMNGAYDGNFDWLAIARRRGFEDKTADLNIQTFKDLNIQSSSSPTPSPTPTPTPSDSPTPTPTPIPDSTSSPQTDTTTTTVEATPTPIPTPTSDATVSPTPTPAPTESPTPTPAPTESPTPTLDATPIP